MKKKVLSFILALSVVLSAASISAYDETRVSAWMENHANTYKSLEDIDNDREKLINELMSDYECAETEAEQVFTDFRENMSQILNKKDNTDKNGTDEDNKQDENPAEVKIDDETINKKSVLSQMKIITNADFDYKTTASREIFAAYVANMINYGTDYSDEKGYFEFNDVGEDNEHYAAIASLINKGAVIGVGGGAYLPGESITLNQACALVVRLSGYDIYKMPSDENDVFYWNKANELKLLKGISAGQTSALTGKDAVTLLYNLMLSDVVSVKFDGKNATYAKDGTFLDKYMGLNYAEDIVEANSKTSLKSGNGAVGKNTLKIGGNVYNFGETQGLDDYLGKKVRVYYDKDDDGEAKAIAELDKYNSSFTVLAEDINNYDMSDRKLYYETEKKTEKEEIYKDTSIIFNGVAVDYETNMKAMLMPDVGEVIFLDNDRDDKADVVFINSYVYYLVGMMNTANPIIYDEFGIQPAIDLKKKDVTVYKNGEEVAVSNIASGWVLMVAPPKVNFVETSGVTYMYVDIENSDDFALYASSEQVSGEIKKYSSKDNKIYIGDQQYVVSKWLTKTNKLFPDNDKFKIAMLGSNVTITLDSYGNIVYFIINSNPSIKYGYVKKLVLDEEADTESYIARIFTQDNEHISVELADKVKVYKKWDESSKLSESTYYAKNIKASEVARLNGESFKKQLIKYSLDKDGKLKTIYIADTTNTSNKLAYDFNFYAGDNVFMKAYSNVGNSTTMNYWTMEAWYSARWDKVPTVYFKIPKNGGNDDDYQADIDNAICGFNNIEYYDITEAGEVRCVVGYVEDAVKGGKKTGDELLMVVSEAPEPSWDDKKEQIVYTMEAYAPTQVTRIMNEGTFRKFTFAAEDMVSFPISTTGKERYSQIPITELKVGDLLSAFTGDTDNVIQGYMVIEHDLGELIENDSLDYGNYNVSPSVTGSGYEVYTGVNTALPYFTKGKVEKAVNNSIFYVNCKQERYVKINLKRESFSKDLVVIYDYKDNKVKEATYSDIRTGDYLIAGRDKIGLVVRQ